MKRFLPAPLLLLLQTQLLPLADALAALRVLYAGPTAVYQEYSKELKNAFQEAKLDAIVTNDTGDTHVDYIIYSPKGPLNDF